MKQSYKVSILLFIIFAAAASWFYVNHPENTPGVPVSTQEKPLNVVLVTLDTTRADHIGVFGADPQLTPAMDTLASAGVAFSNASSVAFGTTPSHTSIMTSTHSRRHGVYNNLMAMSLSSVTIAEILKANGFRTAAFIGAFPVNEDRNFDQGFDHFDGKMDPAMMDVENRAATVCDSAIKWLDADFDSPLFLWVHLFDPHLEYDPPEPFRSKFLSAAGLTGNYYLKLFKRDFTDEDNGTGLPFRENNHIRTMNALYAGEIAYTDFQLRRLISWFARNSQFENTLFIIVADHGETLNEFRQSENYHHHSIYEEVLRVPLIMKFPEKYPGGVKTAAPVSTLDILPTILDVAGIKAPDDAPVEGVSLTAFAYGTEPAGAFQRPIFFEMGNRIGAGVRLGRWKYLRVFDQKKYSKAAEDRCDELLFNLDADPSELSNIAVTEPDKPKLEELRNVFNTWWETGSGTTGDRKEPAKELSGEDQKNKIRQLGYIQ